MVEKNKKYRTNYTYGNLAYEYEYNQNDDKKVNNRVKTKKRSYKKIKTLIKIMSVTAMAFMILLRSIYIAGMSNEVRLKRNEVTTIQNENQSLEAKVALGDNIKNLDKYAVDKHFVKPTDSSIIYVNVKSLTKIDENTKVSFYDGIKEWIGFLR